jgi:hypothetical protein
LASFHALRTSLISSLAADMRVNLSRVGVGNN